jgi:putative ABC transport system permease protein
MIPAVLQAFQRNTLAVAGKVDLTVTSKTSGSFSPAITETIADTEGVAEATPSLRLTATLPRNKANVNAVTVVGLDPATAEKVRNYPLAAGRFMREQDSNVIVLSGDLAKRLGLALGSTFTVPSATGSTNLTVVGLLKTPAQPGIEEVFVPLRTAQAIFRQDARINTVDALFTADADRDAMTKTIQDKLGPLYRVGALESGSELLAAVRMGQSIMNLFGIMALAMGAFIILNTFRTAVSERRHDIGMLRALGASRRTVLGAFLAEGLLQGVVGSAIGLMVGYGMTLGLIAIVRPLYEKYFPFSISGPVFTPGNLALAVGLGVGVAVLGALSPAVAASRVIPVEALRPAIGETYQRATTRRAWLGAIVIAVAVVMLLTRNMSLAGLGSVLFLTGIVLAAPALVKPIAEAMIGVTNIVFRRESSLATGNVTRQPNRAAVTASAIMISLAIVVALSGTITSIFDAFTGYLDKSMGTDFLILPRSLVLASGNVGAGPQLSEELRSIEGVGTVTSLRISKTQINGTAVQAIGIDPKGFSSMATLEFGKGSSAAAFDKLAQGRYAIANGIYAAQQTISTGDKIKLITPEGPRTYTVSGIGSDYLNAKLSTIFISQENLSRDFHETNDLVLMANAKKGADKTTVQAEVKRLVSQYPAFTLYDVTTWRQMQLDTFNQSMGLFYFMLILLALPSLLALINTLTINVVARMHEIGMVRAVGGTRRQIRRMVLAESLMLVSIGIGFGILAGLWLGYVFVGAMNSLGFTTPYYFPWTGILLTIAVGLIFGVLASVLPARQAARLNIVEALHYE